MDLEFEEAGNLLEANRDATTISIEDDVQPEKQRKAAGSSPGGDEDPSAYDDSSEVRTTQHFNNELLSVMSNINLTHFASLFSFFLLQLLSGQKKSIPFWTFEYYQQFFDIETHHVIFFNLLKFLPQFVILERVHQNKGSSHWLQYVMCISSRWRRGSLDHWCHGLGRTLFRSTFGEILIFMVSMFHVLVKWLVISQRETQTGSLITNVCACRAILDLHHSCVCHCHQWQYIQLYCAFRWTTLQVYPRV